MRFFAGLAAGPPGTLLCAGDGRSAGEGGGAGGEGVESPARREGAGEVLCLCEEADVVEEDVAGEICKRDEGGFPSGAAGLVVFPARDGTIRSVAGGTPVFWRSAAVTRHLARVGDKTPRTDLQSAMSTSKKAKTTEGLNTKLALVTKSGKYVLGTKSTIKSVRDGKCKLIVVSSNCPRIEKARIEYYAILGKVRIVYYSGTNVELGTACGKYFGVSMLSIIDAGDADLSKSV